MVKSSKIEYLSYIYILLGLLIIGSIIILFVKIHSLNSKVDNTNNVLNNTNNVLNNTNNDLNNTNNDLNNLKNSFNELNLTEVLKELSNPKGIVYAGGDGNKALLPSDVYKYIGYGKIGFIQQHLDLAGNFGYCNVMVMIPSNNVAYISQISLSDFFYGNEKMFYIRYSKGTVGDVSANPPKNDTWSKWTQVNSPPPT